MVKGAIVGTETDPSFKRDCRSFTGYSPCEPFRTCPGCHDYDPVDCEILIINLEGLGDVLRTTAQLPAIKDQHPRSRITWLTRPRARELLEGHPLLDRVMVLETEDLAELSARSFELLLCVDKSPLSGSLAMQINAGEKRGFGVDERGVIIPLGDHARYLYRLGLDDHLKFHKNQLTEPRLLSEALALPYRREPYRLYLPPAPPAGHPRLVGFNTGASPAFPRKALSVDLQEAAIALISRATGEPVLLLGGPEDRHRNEELSRRLGPRVENSPLGEGLMVGAAHVQRCQVVFSGDSLGMHMAIALGKYVVAWFGPTCHQEIDLYDRGLKLLSGLDCAPCWHSRCQRRPACNESLSAGLVAEAVLDCLDASRKALPVTGLRSRWP